MNKLVIQLMTTAAMREIEIATLVVSDFISANGELNELFIIDAERAYNGRERPILFSHDDLKQSIEQYITLLKAERVLASPLKSYLGLCPTALFIVNPETFKPFGVQKRGTKAGGAVNYAPYTLNRYVDELITNAGLSDIGIKRKSLTRLYVIEAFKSDITIKDICLTSGLSVDTIMKVLAMDLEQYSPLVQWWNKRERAKEARIDRMKKIRQWTFRD
ncbi:hypothetical protein IB292_02440 [Vibrio parahaemolyticus]|uniref:Uncharacterized protein n=1 Tax=Vibrio parahaemolyticus TaxID=670 RepID=A0A9Q3U9R3_VIBPH|nr:hypothetical protein [Vibrio parahaemolyticus]MCC3803887.1 hypothetical protein [Vibrio parahaemolyticus]